MAVNGAALDTLRRSLGLSIGETAIVCGRNGKPVAEKTVNNWINDRTPIPEDAFESLNALEEKMDGTVNRLVKAACAMTDAGPIIVRRYRTADDLAASHDDIGIPLGAHAVMTAWLDAALAAEGIDTNIVWADTVD